MNTKPNPAELEQRRRRHEWACKEACLGCENLRRVDGRWQIKVGESWRTLDPVTPLGEPVR
jgi:hypothetical protein